MDVHTHHITQSELYWKCLISLEILGITNHFLIVQQLLALDDLRELLVLNTYYEPIYSVLLGFASCLVMRNLVTRRSRNFKSTSLC